MLGRKHKHTVTEAGGEIPCTNRKRRLYSRVAMPDPLSSPNHAPKNRAMHL